MTQDFADPTAASKSARRLPTLLADLETKLGETAPEGDGVTTTLDFAHALKDFTDRRATREHTPFEKLLRKFDGIDYKLVDTPFRFVTLKLTSKFCDYYSLSLCELFPCGLSLVDSNKNE